VVAGVNPVKLLVYVPVPVPVVTLYVEAPELVPYTTPRVVTAAPPSEVMVPPAVAVEEVMDVAEEVPEMDGAIANVVKLLSGPYAVPILFVA
jgi:hypothetical protein